MMKKIFITQLVLTMILSGIKAQDFHLSQSDAAPHYFTPAKTGVYFEENEKADYKIYSDYRTQWRAFGVKPYSTFYLAYDMPIKEQYGLGAYLISNRNGAGGLNTIQFMPSGAYRITKDKNGEHQLSVGAELGIVYTSFDPGRYTYENQFSPNSPTVFDPNMPSGETFGKTSMTKIDAAMGVFYRFNKKDWKAHPWLGYSVYNLTRPNQSFTGFGKDKLPMRWVYQLGADYKLNEDITVKPAILYMMQAKAHDLTIGATSLFHLKETKYNIIAGLNYRNTDAFIIQAGMRYEQYNVVFSYDINTSYLNNYTNGRGAFEFSLLLTGIKGKPLFNPKFLSGKNNKSL
jgi:type IX secretion system PorP/SprF family membrane protein